MTHTRRALLLLVAAAALVFGWAVAAAAGEIGHEIEAGGSNEDLCDVNASGAASEQSGDVCSNYGDNDGSVDQSGTASSGDGVAGQVAGVVAAGDASVDATNRTEDASVETGDATGTNEAVLDVGHDIAFLAGEGGENNDLCVTEAEGGLTTNSGDSCVNDGDNDATIDQLADATSGDGVAGQVVGLVTSAGGSADLVLASESEDVDTTTGDGSFDNFSDALGGHDIVFDVLSAVDGAAEENGGADEA